jgi:hypothetical protein
MRIDLIEIGLGSVEWIQLAQDRGCCKYGDDPSGFDAMEFIYLQTRTLINIYSLLLIYVH